MPHAKCRIADPAVAETEGRAHMISMLCARLIPLAAVATLVLAGCEAVRDTAEVTQFHNMPVASEGRTFMVKPTDESKSSSLEFETYARSVIAELQARGYRQAPSLDRSDLLVLVDYAVDQGRVESYPAPVYGYYPDRFTHVHGVRRRTKGKDRPFSEHVYESGGFVPLGYSDVTETVFTRSLSVEIVDAREWQKGNTVKRYEGTVTSVGSSDNLSQVMPRMIEALFADFPGQSGATRSVVLAPAPQ